MREAIRKICENKASFDTSLDALFSDQSLIVDSDAATYVLFKIPPEHKISLVMKHQLAPSYSLANKIYLESDDALNLMVTHRIPLLKPSSYTPITMTYLTAFAIILPILQESISNFAMILTTPQGFAIAATVLALYCLVVYPLLYSFLHWWNPQFYIKFNTKDLIKEGAKLFSVMAVRLGATAGTTALGLSPLLIDILSASTMTFFEELLVSAEQKFSNWSLNPWAILSNISSFLLGAIHNSLTANISGILKPLFLGAVGQVELMWILNFSYNMAYSFTFGKLILTSMGELQRYCLSKEKSIDTYSFSSPLRQCLPAWANSAVDTVIGCVGSTVNSVGGCFAYLGRTVVDCTNIININTCLQYAGFSGELGNQGEYVSLLTLQPKSYDTISTCPDSGIVRPSRL